jgi:hypothetical protein
MIKVYSIGCFGIASPHSDASLMLAGELINLLSDERPHGSGFRLLLIWCGIAEVFIFIEILCGGSVFV